EKNDRSGALASAAASLRPTREGVAGTRAGQLTFTTMNLIPTLTPILADVTQRFNGRIEAVHARQPNEVYFHARLDLVSGFCGHLYKKWNARLVSVFADDARDTDGAFLLYYVYALDAAHGFFILRVPGPADNPEFTSLANAVPAVNWQEREI